MKRLVKRGLKVIWRCTAPARRPIARKLEGFLRRCLQAGERGLPAETDVLMDHVVRELVRLQCQVEALENTLLELLPARDDRAIAGEIAPGSSPDEQLRAG